MILFPDSHFFLHYRDPRELPWSEVSSASQITLMVGRTVQKELEKHKFGLRGRPQDRARDYVAKLADIVTTGSPQVLREANPKILLDFAPARPPGWSMPSDLDPAWQDDQLIADVLASNAVNPGEAVAVLTGDPGVLATAKAHELDVISIAKRHGELPAETSPLEKELEKVKRENAELKRNGPSISCELRDGADKLENLRLKAQWFPPLSADNVEEVVNAVRVAHPETTDFDKPSPDSSISSVIAAAAFGQKGSEWIRPTSEEIEAYRQKYSQWIAGLKTFVADTHLRLAPQVASVELDLIICNEGFEPADGVIVSIETVGGFLLSRVGRGEDVAKSKENDPAKIERYPDPPRPPSPLTKIDRWDHVLKLDRSKLGDGGFPYARLISADKGPPTNVAAIIERIVNPIPPISKPRDRYTFYWRDTDVRDDVTRWQFECAEFPHHAEPKLFPLRLIADLEDPRARHGALKVKLSARNLREPFTATFALQQDVTLGDTISRIWTLMPGTSRRLRSSRP